MKEIRRLLAAGTVAAAVLTAAMPRSAPAGSAGLAWDSVTKIAVGAQPSALQPGSFDDDFAAASSVQAPAQGGGGLFGRLKQAVAAGQGLGQMMQTGMAERHYVAGSKERTDHLATATATITDCAARTITTLNLSDRTYRVESMDHPNAPGPSGRSSSPGGGADDTRVAIAIRNSSLGARTVGGEPTNGYRSDMTFTESGSGGESHSQDAQLVAYYSARRMPYPDCFRFGSFGAMTPGGGMAMMGAAARMMQALASSGSDKRFSLTQSGPALPAGNFAMYEAIAYAFQGPSGVAVVTERGHVRPIASDDPSFQTPSGFTQER